MMRDRPERSLGFLIDQRVGAIGDRGSKESCPWRCCQWQFGERSAPQTVRSSLRIQLSA